MGTDGGFPPDVGERLRAARQAAGLSLAELATRIPFSRSYLGHVETGTRVASADVIAAYMRACGEMTCGPVILGDLPNAARYYEVATNIWDRETHARVWALSAAETGLLRWKLGKHTDAVDMWRTAVPALHAVKSARAAAALARIRRTAPELLEDTGPTGIPAM
ncbi:multiprotein-bridging factor 1 family protein [Nocardia beijingensis]|uniref:Multiprotein-bridging factor 1 family protein n=1 Tax=Nocardia beijingensis TaxID=95162 RepID=A0ABW7WIN2_9NOCA